MKVLLLQGEAFKPYDYFFIMETDSEPIRPLWIDRLYVEVKCTLLRASHCVGCCYNLTGVTI